MRAVKNDQHTPSEVPAENVYRLLVESSPAGIFILKEGKFHYVNMALARMFGYRVDDMTGRMGLIDLADGEYRKKLSENVALCRRGELPEIRLRFRGMTREEEPVYAEVHASLVVYGQSTAIAGTIDNYGDHFKADEILNETLNRYRSFFNEDIAAHYVTAEDGTIIDCNDAFARLLGFSSRREALQENAGALYPVSTERDRFIELVKERKRLTDHRAEYVRRDGMRVYVRESAVGEFDPSGSLAFIRGHLIDETGERRLEETLFQSQRIETLGTLVGGIAHDFNNILGVIIGHMSLMDRWRGNPEKFGKSFEAVRKVTERGANTVKQLMTFARKVEIVTQSVRIDDAVNEIVELLKETFPERIVFRVELEPDIPTIHADPNQLHQVLMNLCVNARDAMPKGGTISIAGRVVDGEEVSRRFREVGAERYVELKVSDTGTGMDGSILSRIFEPFFTTKGSGRGSGLGLAVVYGIMKAHNGFVGVESKVGAGTTFSLYFPIPAQPVEIPTRIGRETEVPRGNGELILVVEDEEHLRDFLAAFLGDSGYDSLLAPDGTSGIRTYRERLNEVSVVILDMGLPGMSGAEVLAELKMLNPEVKVILASGYIEPEIKNDAFAIGALDFLPKPYQADELLIKLHRVLHAQSKGDR